MVICVQHVAGFKKVKFYYVQYIYLVICGDLMVWTVLLL